jgi:[ribosomal protein S18]-alanine N-acetyltransferase
MRSIPYTIRNAGKGDIASIYRIEVESLASPWSRESFLKELSTAFSHFIVAEANGGIAGYAVAWEVKGEVQLNHVVVERDRRRQGIGTALLEHLVERLKGKGAVRVLLEVRSLNAEARSFYDAMGFMEDGLRKRYYHDDDAVLMRKELGS